VSTPVRFVAAALAAVLLSGCAFDRLWNDVPAGREPVSTPAPSSSASTTPPQEQDERTAHPYTGALAADARCVTASRAVLEDVEFYGMVGGAVTYPVGARVKANAKWWTIAVATRVNKNDDGYTRANVPRYEVFVSNAPSYDEDESEADLSTWKLTATAGDAAAAKALACVKRLPIPKPKTTPKPWASYTGKLAAHAKCVALTTAQLTRFQDVGQVGGAITYPRGFRVKANLRWWTVAVATQVNPNGEGYTKDNVPPTALFVTSAPTSKASGVSFPINRHTSDAAARKALACLG
jgi:hypothetical protein